MQQSLRTSYLSSTVLYLENKLKNYDDYLQIQKDYRGDDTHFYDLFLYFIQPSLESLFLQ